MASRLFSPLIFVLFDLLVILGLNYFIPIAMVIPMPIRYLGIILIAFGVFFALWTEITLRRNNSTTLTSEVPSRLVTTGPYKYSRNPEYLGYMFVLVGTAISAGSLSAWIPIFTSFTTLKKVYMSYEEEQLQLLFTREYNAYKKAVRRWL